MSERGFKILSGYNSYLKLKQLQSRKDHLRTVRDFLGWCCDREIEFCVLSEALAMEYQNTLVSSQKLKIPTINNQINRLRGFYRYLVKNSLCYSNPFAVMPRLKNPLSLPKTILSVDQMGRLLSGFTRRTPVDFMVKSVVELLYGSSLRIGEVALIRLDKLDFAARTLEVVNLKHYGEMKRVPLTEDSILAISDYLELSEALGDSDYLYPQKGESWLRSLVNRRLERECKRLGLPVITSHSLRHCSATHCLKAGASLPQVQMLLSHSRIRSTEVYTRVVKEDLKEALLSFHPREQEIAL